MPSPTSPCCVVPSESRNRTSFLNAMLVSYWNDSDEVPVHQLYKAMPPRSARTPFIRSLEGPLPLGVIGLTLGRSTFMWRAFSPTGGFNMSAEYTADSQCNMYRSEHITAVGQRENWTRHTHTESPSTSHADLLSHDILGQVHSTQLSCVVSLDAGDAHQKGRMLSAFRLSSMVGEHVCQWGGLIQLRPFTIYYS